MKPTTLFCYVVLSVIDCGTTGGVVQIATIFVYSLPKVHEMNVSRGDRTCQSMFNLGEVFGTFRGFFLIKFILLCHNISILLCLLPSSTFILLACPECNSSVPFSGASSIPLCYVLFPATLLHQLFFDPLSPHLAIYFLVFLSILLFPNSYIIPFWEFYFLPFSVHAQTNVIYLTLLSLLQ